MTGASPSLWYAALASEVGIIIATDDPHLLRQKLYAIRKELKDPDLDGISILESPTNPKDLWLVKRETQRNVSTTESDPEPSRG